MKACFRGFAAAAVLLAAFDFTARAEDAPAAVQPPAPTQAAPTGATPSEAKPAPDVVPRPALVPKSTDAATDATTQPAPSRHRRYARHDYRHYAYWEPFPLYLPHFYRNHIVWNRISWFHF
jgi:hypothetical protein